MLVLLARDRVTQRLTRWVRVEVSGRVWMGSIHSPGVERGGSKRATAAVSRPVSIRSRKGTHLAKEDLGFASGHPND
jgi:hypothetical protein